MEESKALSKLGDVADLLVLLEDILNPASIERLSQASWSGIRLTLKNARGSLQESQVALSKEFVARARTSGSLGANEGMSANGANRSLKSGIQQENGHTDDGEAVKAQIIRRDLKASLEKYIETR